MPGTRFEGPGFHHVAIRSRNFEESLRFYDEALGYKRVYGWGEGDKRAALLDTGDGNYVELFAGSKCPPGEDLPDGPIFHFAIRVPDTDAAYAKAIAAGARSQMEPKTIDIQGDREITVRIAFVRGPDGESIEFFQNQEL